MPSFTLFRKLAAVVVVVLLATTLPSTLIGAQSTATPDDVDGDGIGMLPEFGAT